MQIFDGKSLTGWDGDPAFWRAENGSIVGESTPQKRVTQNTFLIWRGERLRDFELKIDFRLGGTNSGVQSRSAELPAVGRWVLSGYQADMDFKRFTGNIHKERGREPTRPRAARSIRDVDGPVFKSLGTIADAEAAPRHDQRQQLESVSHHRAGALSCIQIAERTIDRGLIDEDAANRALEGVLGLPDARRRSVQGRVPEHLGQAAVAPPATRRRPNDEQSVQEHPRQ